MALSCVNGCRECDGCLSCQGGYESTEGRSRRGEKSVMIAEYAVRGQARPALWKEREEKRQEDLRQMLRRMDELRQEMHRARGCMEDALRRATNTTRALSMEPRSTQTGRGRMEAAVLDNMDLEQELSQMKAELDGLRGKARTMMESLGLGTRRTIVKLRFLEGISCAGIAWRLHYSRSYVYKTLGAGIAEMARHGVTLPHGK